MESLLLKYRTGEEIRKGDRVLFHGNQAEIEFVATDSSSPELTWFMQQYGGGVMVLDPIISGSTFIPADHIDNYEYLEYVSRA